MGRDPAAAVANGEIELTVTDLKQWDYCHRIPFYRYVLPVEHHRTYKMERGKAAQSAVEALERRRRLRGYSLREGERRFGVWLRSERLGLSGKLDLLIVTPDACFPVDFKDTEGGVRRNHRVQLAAYALLVEEKLERQVPDAFVCIVPRNEIVPIDLTAKDRIAVMEALRDIRKMVSEESLPEPTSLRTRCVACEFQNYCADVW